MLSTRPPPGELSILRRLVNLCLHLSTHLSRVFLRITACLQALILPQGSQYQMRVYFVTLVQIGASDLMLLTLAKVLQVYYRVSNFLLLLSVGAILPFLRTVYQLWFYIPCPPMASIISNIALALSFVVLLLLGIGTYAAMGGWIVYTYIMTVWPWLVLMSMISRLYIERQVGKNPLSPVRELPILGGMSAFGLGLSLMAAKEISISDCIVISCLDPILAAVLASTFLGPTRRKLHFRNVKIYVLLALLVLVFPVAATGGQFAFPSYHQSIFVAARLLCVARSIFVKWSYASYGPGTKPPPQPQENGLLFFSHERPKKNRFSRFPAPALFTLDVIFDSGLRDSEFHAMGPLGTQDLLSLTEGTYLLPVSALMAWTNEFSNLQFGVLPQGEGSGVGSTAVEAVQNATSAQQLLAAESCSCCPTIDVNTPAPRLITDVLTSIDSFLLPLILVLFCCAMLLRPHGAAVAMFDRGSSVHSWKYQPIIIATPFFVVDVLFLNEALSLNQLIVVVATAVLLAHFRSDLWTYFKRRYLLLCTQELHYFQPAVVRQLQRKTLIEFLNDTSTDDYGMLLLETAIRHGANIRELARDTSVIVWDPAPTATAAWKLALSLVQQSLRRQKLLAKRRLDEEREHERYVANLVIEFVERAIDIAAGHSAVLRLAGSLAGNHAKRRALRILSELARARKQLRQQRRAGQLSVSAASRSMRSIKDSTFRQQSSRSGGSSGQLRSPSSLEQPFAALASLGQHSSSLSGGLPRESSQRLSAQGELSESEADVAEEVSVPINGFSRGIYWASQGSNASVMGGIVLAFGDSRRGQLGQEDGFGIKRAPGTTVFTVEELRGCDPVQVEAAGVTSFVVGIRGQVWGFGSNRSLELGVRREVPQVNAPLRMKGLRGNYVVQVAGSCSTSGQAHTLILTNTGLVFTFGTSPCGALGQGTVVRQTAPLPLRLSSQVPIRYICAGACHSMLVTDSGRLYAMGDNRHGQLGIGQVCQSVNEPVLLEGAFATEHVRLLACGDEHVLVATESNAVFAWGANANGQLGLSRIDDQASPQQVRELHGLGVTSLACGSRHSLVVAQSGTQVWSFGSNVQGQLGIGRSNAADGFQVPRPTICKALSMHHMMEVRQVAAAGCHSLAVTHSGAVYAWGDNTHGQLGFPTAGAAAQPLRVAAEVDVPQAMPERGAATIWEPTRVVSVGACKAFAVSTGDMHTLVLATS